jgi:hypothetical protein
MTKAKIGKLWHCCINPSGHEETKGKVLAIPFVFNAGFID